MWDELVKLAGAGGSALVGAMATDAWQATRSEVARLFGRGGPVRRSVIEAQLDRNADSVEHAANPDEVRRNLAAGWRLELEALLREHPEVEEEVRALVAQVAEALPASHYAWVQTNIAHEQATQNIVQHGSLHVHRSDGPAGGGAPGAGGAG